MSSRAQNSSATKPKRVNKAIELLEQGQPIYYTGPYRDKGGYEEGVRMAKTWADYINYGMEHGAFDITNLRQFMRGLVDGGPTKSGHRTPAVIVQLPAFGLDEASMRANHWVIQQVLASGVHGLYLTHARSPEAVRFLVRASRYPFQRTSVGPDGLQEGLRGAGSQTFAAEIWGFSVSEYLKKADVWPLNPEGEILLGIKIEDKHALANAEESTKVPGIGFAEWGPSDMAMSFGITRRPGAPFPPEMQRARSRVFAACKAAKIAFLNSVNENNVEDMIREGVMIGAGDEKAAEKGRRFTKRSRPW